MNGADGDELTGNGMEVELKGSDLTSAEMAERGAEKLRRETTRIATAWRRGYTIRHGKAKNGAHGRSCGIAQLGTDHQGDGEAAMGRESKCIERLLNGKAKTRVELRGHGKDRLGSS